MEKFREENDSILSNQERDKILCDLFEGKEGSLDSSFLYKGKGAELYADISRDKSYPFIDIEISCLEKLKNNEKFKKILDKTEYITDVGSGDGQKAVALLGGTGWKGTYLAEDYSYQMLDIAEKRVKSSANIKVGSLQKLNGQSHLSSQCPNNMYLFLGGTICNMTDEEIINELRNMDNNGFIDGNNILLSYFTAPKTQEEIDKLIKIYNSDTNKAFHENGMDMLGLSKDDFEFDTIYVKDNPSQTNGPFPGRIKGVIRAKKDSIVKLSNGREISLKKGQEFTIHYSRRFTKKGIEDLFKKSGCNTVFTIDKGGDSIVLLKKKPLKVKKFLNKHRIPLLLLLAAGTLGIGTLIGGAINERKQKEREKEKIELESRDYRLDYRDATRGKNERISDMGTAEGTALFQDEQDKILMAEYNISSMNKTLISDSEETLIGNEIIDMYNEEFYAHFRDGRMLTAERFMELYGGKIIDKYHIPYQEPYEHFKEYESIIKNTIKYGDKIDLSKHIVTDINQTSGLSYYIKGTAGQDIDGAFKFYHLKIVRVYLDNGKTIDLMVGKQDSYYFSNSKKGNYSLKDGYRCMQDLVQNYGYVLE